jgi:glycosyltransferase involved in cell wall biosynthesis
MSTLHSALDVRIFQKECRALAAAGHEVHYLVQNPPLPSLDGVQFRRFRRPEGAFRPGRIGRRLAEMHRRARDLRADVYHFHNPELIPVGLLLKRIGARVIYDVHEHSPQEAITLNKDRPWDGRWKAWAWTILEKWAMRSLDAFVCATPAIARGFPPDKTITVRNFPPLVEAEMEVAYARRPHHLAYTGLISGVRGIREMIRALEFLPEGSAARLHMAGNFSEPKVQAEVQQLPGWRRVHFVGYQSRGAVQALLAQARLGLVLYHPEPDHLEAEPNKLFEYMAAGLPVVASDFPHWRKIVAQSGSGLVVDPRDPGAIARAVQYLLDHPADAEEMGRRGRREVVCQYNWEAEARKLVELYDRLSGRSAEKVKKAA